MTILHHSPLGQQLATPSHYDPTILFPIPRQQTRKALGIHHDLPFIGHDRWHLFELSWLNEQGVPHMECATLLVPAQSPFLVESKSLKLYLNSLNQEIFSNPKDVQARIQQDLSTCLQSPVSLSWGLPPWVMRPEGICIDLADTQCHYDHEVHPDYLQMDPSKHHTETLWSNVFRSNCPVTSQPDWASVHIQYNGPKINQASLLRYLSSYRLHQGFHEQCVEQIFLDILQHCKCDALSVEARFTRRGGIDINPWRATLDTPTPIMLRDLRQ